MMPSTQDISITKPKFKVNIRVCAAGFLQADLNSENLSTTFHKALSGNRLESTSWKVPIRAHYLPTAAKARRLEGRAQFLPSEDITFSQDAAVWTQHSQG